MGLLNKLVEAGPVERVLWQVYLMSFYDAVVFPIELWTIEFQTQLIGLSLQTILVLLLLIILVHAANSLEKVCLVLEHLPSVGYRDAPFLLVAVHQVRG